MTMTARSPADSAVAREAIDRMALVFAQIAVAAGAVVLDVYRRGATVRTKADSSPVCEADELAERLIHRELARALQDIPVVAEEAAARGEVPDVGARFILVDPLDGTKEFISGNGEFTVNIALIEEGVPRAGAVYAPVLERLWFAGSRAFACRIAPGATLAADEAEPIHVRRRPATGLTVMASRSHGDSQTEDFLAAHPVAERRNAGSSLKFCALAEGEADLYPRFGPTMEWDTAAGDAVLRGAGGIVRAAAGGPLRYAKPGFRNGAFIAWGDPRD